MTKRFLSADQLLAGDRLYKLGVTLTFVGHDEHGNVVVEYAHKPGRRAAWAPTRKFHVARAA